MYIVSSPNIGTFKEKPLPGLRLLLGYCNYFFIMPYTEVRMSLYTS